VCLNFRATSFGAYFEILLGEATFHVSRLRLFLRSGKKTVERPTTYIVSPWQKPIAIAQKAGP